MDPFETGGCSSCSLLGPQPCQLPQAHCCCHHSALLRSSAAAPMLVHLCLHLHCAGAHNLAKEDAGPGPQPCRLLHLPEQVHSSVYACCRRPRLGHGGRRHPRVQLN